MVEVDIASSQPQLLWGRYCYGEEPEGQDLYAIIVKQMRSKGHQEVTREGIKRDVLEIIGKHGPAKRTGDKQADPNKVKRQRLIVEQTPWLRAYVEDEEFTQAQLVFRESEALLNAMSMLRARGIPCLPIHDSLLVGMVQPDADEVAVEALEEAWRQFFAPCPRATVKAKLRGEIRESLR